jgi:hypothetical protein
MWHWQHLSSVAMMVSLRHPSPIDISHVDEAGTVTASLNRCWEGLTTQERSRWVAILESGYDGITGSLALWEETEMENRAVQCFFSIVVNCSQTMWQRMNSEAVPRSWLSSWEVYNSIGLGCLLMLLMRRWGWLLAVQDFKVQEERKTCRRH